jgi:hypothetical protein
VNVFIVNSKSWDRTIEALWKNLKSQKYNSTWLGFKMPEDFKSLTGYIEESYDEIRSLTLLGSFRDWEDHEEGISIELKDIFANSKLPRVWLMLFDLHHSINDLLHGLKSNIKGGIDGVSSTQIDPTLFFDCLAWGYEHIDFYNPPDESLFGDQGKFTEAKRTFDLAQDTWLKLCHYFPSRLAFYHCLDLREISSFRPINLLRMFDVGIPGSLYETRIKARDLFFQSGCSITPSGLISKIFGKLTQVILQLLKVLHIKEGRRKIEVKRKLSFSKLNLICQLSRFVWVDGSYLRYPVRKYFEVPALNTLLISPENNSIKALEIFEEWQLVSPEHLTGSNLSQAKIGKRDKKQLIERQKLKLLRDHTASVRLKALGTFISYLHPNVSTRGYYQQGELIFERNDKDEFVP